MTQLHKFSLKSLFIRITMAAFFFTITWKVDAQRVINPQFGSPLTSPVDSIKPLRSGADTIKPRTTQPTDKIKFIGSDTTHPVNDSISHTDTFSLKLSKDSLDAPVEYFAKDSAVVMIGTKKIYLYGQTKTDYQDITLTAPKVEID